MTSLLNERERLTLVAVCDTLMPKLEPAPGDSPELFGLCAADVDLAGAVEQAMAALTTRQQKELRLFIRLLDSPIFMLPAVGVFREFSSMRSGERHRALLRLANHPLPPLRAGFQALKRLASFLFYAVPGSDGTNPAATALGYSLPRAVRGANALTISRPPRNAVLEADVCVVGSGAAGGVVAARLAAAGQRVIVLEAGPPDQAEDFDQRELVGTRRLYLDQGTTTTRDLGVVILAGSAIGGGTAVNWQTCLPLPDFIRDEWASRSGLGVFTSDEFTAAFDTISARVHARTSESVRNANNARLERGCTVLGYRWSEIARNAHGCDQAQCGFCVYGCRVGGKQSTATTWLVDAQRDHHATIVANCRVERVHFDGRRATGVEATVRTEDDSATTLRVNAKAVVVAAGAIETPALLLRSGVEHRELGRNLTLHPTTAVAGRYDEPVRGWIGAPQTVMCAEFARLDGNHGYRLETSPIHPGLLALALPWHEARRHREHVQQSANISSIIVLSRDRNAGRVRVESDGRAVIDYIVGSLERRLLAHGMATAARIHHAAGAREILTLHAREHVFVGDSGRDFESWCRAIDSLSVAPNRCGVFSAHQMGTCRMGRDPRTAVCDEAGGVHEHPGLYVADASLFPASSGVNPMLTIMALAYVIAERVRV